MRHGHVISASSAGSEHLSISPALHLPNRSVQRNHLEPFYALPATSGIPPPPYDEDVDGLGDGEELSSHQHHQHHQHQRLHGRSNRAVRATVRDTPPRIELPNVVWSSLDIGSDAATPSTSARGVTNTTTMTMTNHDRAIVSLDGAEGNDDDDEENDPPEDGHNINVYPRFRDHLDSALQALRSPSPLVPGLVESSNTLTSAMNNDDEQPTTDILDDPESHPSPISFAPPPVTPSALTFSNNDVAPLQRDSQSQSLSNSTFSSSSSSSPLSEAVQTPNLNMVRRFGRPPTLPPILTEPTNLSSSSSSNSARGDSRYTSHRRLAPLSVTSSRDRDGWSVRTRRISILADDHDRNGGTQVGAHTRGLVQRSSNLGEVELPSPSLSEVYQWLGSPGSPDPDLMRDVGVPMAREDNSVRRSSGLSREETRQERRDVEHERRARRSWEDDVLSG